MRRIATMTTMLEYDFMRAAFAAFFYVTGEHPFERERIAIGIAAFGGGVNHLAGRDLLAIRLGCFELGTVVRRRLAGPEVCHRVDGFELRVVFEK